jgi:hypothetical protein
MEKELGFCLGYPALLSGKICHSLKDIFSFIL